MVGFKTFRKFIKVWKDSVVLKHVSSAFRNKIEGKKNHTISESACWILIPFSVKARFQSAAHEGKMLEHAAEMDHDL